NDPSRSSFECKIFEITLTAETATPAKGIAWTCRISQPARRALRSNVGFSTRSSAAPTPRVRKTIIAGSAPRMLPMEIVVGVIEPVLTNRAEDVELERIFQRLGLVLDPRRDVQHLALADDDFLAGDQELQRALQEVGHLLALVRVV